MIAAAVLPLAAAGQGSARAVALASVLAIMVAALMILGAAAHLGFIADLLSKPTMIGYLNGLALTILVGQLPKLFGFKVGAEGLIAQISDFARGLTHGDAVAAAAVVGVAGVLVVLVLQRWLPKAPAVLIMILRLGIICPVRHVMAFQDQMVLAIGAAPVRRKRAGSRPGLHRP